MWDASRDGGTRPPELDPCEDRERDRHERRGGDDEPLDGTVMVISVDAEDDFDPVVPGESEQQEYEAPRAKADLDPETPANTFQRSSLPRTRRSVRPPRGPGQAKTERRPALICFITFAPFVQSFRASDHSTLCGADAAPSNAPSATIRASDLLVIVLQFPDRVQHAHWSHHHLRARGAAGRVLGLDRVPEVKTIRGKLARGRPGRRVDHDAGPPARRPGEPVTGPDTPRERPDRLFEDLSCRSGAL